MVLEWTLRKCAAGALDLLSHAFSDEVIQILLPLLRQQLNHSDWIVRESHVLAIGAIAEGCMHHMMPHLPELFPYLLRLLYDPKPLLRIITCWTLGRYSGWAAHSDKEKYLVPLMESLLRKMLDNNKRVQEAACSAFSTMEEKAGLH